MCLRIFAMVLVTATVVVAGCGDDGNSRLDDLPSEDALVAGELTTDEFAEALQIIAEGDVPDETKRAAARTVEFFLDDIAAVALDEAADDFDRRDVVDFAEEISRDETALGYLHESVISWGSARSSEDLPDPELLAGPDLSPLDAPRFPEDVLESVATVTTAFQQGIDKTDSSDDFGTEFRDDIVAALRIDHVSALEGHGVAGVLIDRGLLQPVENYEVEQEYRHRLLGLVYGTEPYADLDGRIVDLAHTTDASSPWN
jgi:hypothetical protein